MTEVQYPPFPDEAIVDRNGVMTLEFNDFLVRLWTRTGGDVDAVRSAKDIGEVFSVAGAAPDLSLACDGSEVAVATYPALAAYIGNTWGTPSSSAFVVLPDLRGRTIIGTGTGSGLTARTLADLLGVETVALTKAQLAAHDHPITDTGHGHPLENDPHTHPGDSADNYVMDGAGTLYDRSADNVLWEGGTSTEAGVAAAETAESSTGGFSGQNVTGISVDSAGGGGAHQNMQPSVALLMVIRAV